MKQLFVILLTQGLLSCNSYPEYIVRSIPDSRIIIDGKANEDSWLNTERITSFGNPWNKETAPNTSFMMWRDSRFVYFYFDVQDDQIVSEPDFSGERDIEKEDRVELFFSKDRKMNEYYCFEMDAMGRTLSYQAKYYRVFNFDWEPPPGYKIASVKHDSGYRVEGCIPLEFIQRLANNGELYFGAYRAEFNRRDTLIEENWLSWVDPKTDTPDFHVPSSMGKLIIK